MRVRVERPTTLQDAGRHRVLVLNVGQVCDLPDIIARAMMASGVVSEFTGSPERKVIAAPETKRARQ